jgi:hypothetical protein
MKEYICRGTQQQMSPAARVIKGELLLLLWLLASDIGRVLSHMIRT